MKGTVRTILAGKQVESFPLEVLGVLRDFAGPSQDIILVRLLGEKATYTGVAAGMSGSPVYFDGKLAGALSYQLGTFAKEPIGGVTPIENMLRAAAADSAATPLATEAEPERLSLPGETMAGMGLEPGTERYMVPIETPLTFVGVHPEAIARFAPRFRDLGLRSLQGGGKARTENTSGLEPGGAVAAALVTGDMNIAATCTITHRIGDQLFACGHAVFAYGEVSLPLARAEIVATVPSEASSFKISNIGDVVGTFRQDRATAIVGEVGPVPNMIPVDLRVTYRGRERRYRFQVFQHPKISPALIDATLFSGLASTTESGEGLSYRVQGRLVIAGHPDVLLDDMFGPTDSSFPDAFFVAGSVGQTFSRVFTNPFERPQMERIELQVEMLPERRSASIENAWADKSEVRPGETLTVKVVLQPYRGPRLVREVSLKVPPQASRGELRILVSDASLLNRITRSQQIPGLPANVQFGPRVSSLEQLIALLNRERRNDNLYVSLFQRTPTLLVEDKVLPSVPLSQINVLNHQQMPGGTVLSGQSILHEVSEPLGQVINGSHWIRVTVR